MPEGQAQDAARFADWLDREYRERMVRFCQGRLGSEAEAEDAVQEIFCKVMSVGEIPENFRPWLYRVAYNHCISLLRSRGRRRDNCALPPASRLDAAATGRLTSLVRREERSRLRHLVAALPTKYREVLELRYGEELTRSEVADVLEIPESLVKSRLLEGLKKLRQHRSLLNER